LARDTCPQACLIRLVASTDEGGILSFNNDRMRTLLRRPRAVTEGERDRKAAKRAVDAIMTMKTIDIAKIEVAQAGLTNTRAVLYRRIGLDTADYQDCRRG
jgi:uncharacterized 2Fe-2S/4Fe-4S cluster protein (DUF4445 family)